MKLTVNGVEHELASSPLTPLLQVLREELSITSLTEIREMNGDGGVVVD